jgi:pilus assembly protein Flp/PilA
MRAWKRNDAARLGGEGGATAVEYSIMVALIALVIIGAVALLGESLSDSYDCSATHVANLTQLSEVDC